jgi:RNA-directed DNA polymerase
MRGGPKRITESTGSARKGYTSAEARDWAWVEDTVWTERMVSALVNGVKGGRWYSLMDKVFAPDTLEAAWEKVLANDGAAGVDGQSIKRFEAGAELYLTESCGTGVTSRSRSGGSRSRRVMDGRGRWESRRSRTASSRRR